MPKKRTEMDATHKTGIKVVKGGPYLVFGGIPVSVQTIICDDEGIPLKWKEGNKYPVMETMALCRCGHSRNKPYCDGAHAKAAFDGTETAGREEYLEHPDRTEGPELILWDVEKLCAVALFCHRAGDAWNLTEQSGDPKKKAIAIQEACDCPSGRLLACDRRTGEPVEPAFEPSIGLVVGPQNDIEGPLWVRGKIPIESADGAIYKTRNRVTLCRCGKSANKPFCDGEHRNASPRLEVPR
jgi:CDGSH-type Zn-finger protein